MNRSLLLLAASPLSLLLLAANGCDPFESGGCTLAGCFDGLTIVLEADSWTPGNHTVEGTADGEPFACGFGPDFVVSCEGGPALSCFNYGDGYRSRCELTFPGLHPERVDVTVRRDGEELRHETLRPDYTKYRPNGPDCDPVCRSAEATVPLDAPAPCGVRGAACTCVRPDECACGTDFIPVPEGWSACPVGSIRSDECSPDRCGCDLDAGIGGCTDSCESDAWTRQTCVGGAWGCHDPAFPIDVSTCP